MSAMSQYYLHVQELVDEYGNIPPLMIRDLAYLYGVSGNFVVQTIKSIKENVNVA